jgi:hypothetical protein
VPLPGEDEFRALLDDRGVVRAGALAPPDAGGAYTVFAQRPDARLDVPALKAQAARFFDAKVGLTVDKRYLAPPDVDAARVVISTAEPAGSGTRLCYGRPSTEADRARADTAERAQGTYGLALLARRCPTVWLVVRQPAAGDEDRAALMLAAILASLLLGPILSPSGDRIFGVRTARELLTR